jgi:hypothetical protein
LNAFKRVFAISTSCRAIGMMILQIRPMMRELVQRAIGRATQPEGDSTARFTGRSIVFRI